MGVAYGAGSMARPIFHLSDFCVNFEQHFRNGRRRDPNQFHRGKNKAPNRLMTHFFLLFFGPGHGIRSCTYTESREGVRFTESERVVLAFRATRGDKLTIWAPRKTLTARFDMRRRRSTLFTEREREETCLRPKLC